jgi:putative ABC transport system substrate-binding protein
LAACHACPRIARVAFVHDPRDFSRIQLLGLVKDAPALAVKVIDAPVQDRAEIEPAIAMFAHEVDGGLIIAFSAFTTVHSEHIVEKAARYHLPAIYPFNFFAKRGGLLTYGVDQAEQFRQAASYVDRILRGERPSDLPVQNPTKFELVINLKTAKVQLSFVCP